MADDEDRTIALQALLLLGALSQLRCRSATQPGPTVKLQPCSPASASSHISGVLLQSPSEFLGER